MNEHAEQWLQALESGQYKQGILALQEGDNYCCLGVACDLAVKARVIPPPRIEQRGGRRIYKGGEYQLLPDVVRDWLGLKDRSPILPTGESLVGLNDTGWKFKQIAALIRSNDTGLFVSGPQSAGPEEEGGT